MTPEGKIKAMVNRRMKKDFPAAYRFMPVQNGMGAPALDYFWCITGLFVAFETKVPGKNLTERQTTTACQIVDAGGMVFVIHNSEDYQCAVVAISRKVLGNDD